MEDILEDLLKGLVLWIYGLILEGVQYLSDSLLNVFSLDLAYFERYAPVIHDIQSVVISVGWALLIGNLVFQATRSMAAGLGFEGEDPVTLGTRTFVFAFLLMGSRQICAIGLNFTSLIMDLFQVPDAVVIATPDENAFGIAASWLLAMLVGLIMIFQVIKFFFEIGERYVVTVILVVLAPLAFGMGGSKNTEDIFKGWCQMFGSMCVMMLMNVIFLKLLLSTMSTMPTGAGVFPWLIFVTAIVRVGRKIDDIVCRMGLNPAQTGSPLGHGFMALPMMMAHEAARTVVRTTAANHTGGKQNPSSSNQNGNRPKPATPPPSPGPSPSPSSGGGSSTSYASGAASNTSNSGANVILGQGNPASQGASSADPSVSASGTAQASAASQSATPTRPPIGRGRTHTPQTGAGYMGEWGNRQQTVNNSVPQRQDTIPNPNTNNLQNTIHRNEKTSGAAQSSTTASHPISPSPGAHTAAVKAAQAPVQQNSANSGAQGPAVQPTAVPISNSRNAASNTSDIPAVDRPVSGTAVRSSNFVSNTAGAHSPDRAPAGVSASQGQPVPSGTRTSAVPPSVSISTPDIPGTPVQPVRGRKKTPTHTQIGRSTIRPEPIQSRPVVPSAPLQIERHIRETSQQQKNPSAENSQIQHHGKISQPKPTEREPNNEKR